MGQHPVGRFGVPAAKPGGNGPGEMGIIRLLTRPCHRRLPARAPAVHRAPPRPDVVAALPKLVVNPD